MTLMNLHISALGQDSEFGQPAGRMQTSESVKIRSLQTSDKPL